jgi:hypothetical protein
MTCATDTKSKRRLTETLAAAFAIAALLAVGVGAARADDRDHRDRRWEHHDRHWDGYRAPPVVYGPAPGYYAPPPVVYSPGISVGLPGINVNIR